jgi:hypothetical protein
VVFGVVIHTAPEDMYMTRVVGTRFRPRRPGGGSARGQRHRGSRARIDALLGEGRDPFGAAAASLAG